MNRKLEFIASVVSLAAVYLISEKILVIGWTLNGIGDVLWIIYGHITKQYYLLLLQVAFLVVCINGLYNAL